MDYITSLTHPLIKQLTKLRKSRRYRQETQRFVLCGRKLILGCCKHAKRALYLDELPISADQSYRTTPEIMKKVGGAPYDLIAELELPPPSSLENERRILALDGVADPGNLGTLLRSALAFGWRGLLLLPGCADPFNDKALRASQGAILQIHYQYGSKLPDCQSLIADAKGDPFDKVSLDEQLLLVLGSEGRGVSPEIPGQRIGIPIEIESLNVAAAGAILLQALRSPLLDRTR